MKKIIQLFLVLSTLNTLNAQKAMKLDIMTDINQLSIDKGINLRCHLQSPMFPQIGLDGGYSIEYDSRQAGNFQYQAKSKKTFGEIRYYPLEEKSNETETVGCYKFSKKNKQPFYKYFTKSLYVASGFEQQEVEFSLSPNKILEAPNVNYNFRIINKAVTFRIGSLIRFSRLSFGLSYGISVGKPYIEGNNEKISTDFIKLIYPSDYRIQRNVLVELGFNF
jgi:hypothetical protein